MLLEAYYDKCRYKYVSVYFNVGFYFGVYSISIVVFGWIL